MAHINTSSSSILVHLLSLLKGRHPHHSQDIEIFYRQQKINLDEWIANVTELTDRLCSNYNISIEEFHSMCFLT